MDSRSDIVLCAKCNDSPEDILILTCEHNLCLNCAANNLHEQEQKQRNSFSTVVCDICRSATVLDPESATELIEIRSRNIIMASDRKKKPKKEKPKTYDSTPIRMKVSQSQSTIQSSGTFCDAHSEELVSYYCLTCRCNPICPECIINGPHSGHEVKLLKHCHSHFIQQIEDLHIQLVSKIEEMQQHDERLEHRRREIYEQEARNKQQIAKAFEDLRHRIDAKERELMHAQEVQFAQMINEVDSVTRLVNGRQDNLAMKAQELEQAIQVQDIAYIAQFFTQNFAIIQKTCIVDSDLPQLRQMPVGKVDLKSLEQFFMGIEAISFEAQKQTSAKLKKRHDSSQSQEREERPLMPPQHQTSVNSAQKKSLQTTSVTQQLSKLQMQRENLKGPRAKER